MKFIKVSILTTSTTANMERGFSVLALFLTKLRNTLVSNSLDRLMQLISVEPHIYDWDRSEKTDLDEFMKKQHSVILSWFNLTIHV